MVAAEVGTSPTFSVVRSTVLFDAHSYHANSACRSYDVSPDDKRFLMIQAPPTGAGLKLVVVENWTQGLAARR
jgi:hypothetical protein